MSLNGGYQILDMKNIPIYYGRPEGTKVPESCYKALNDNVHKTVLVSGLVIAGGTPYDGPVHTDQWVKFYETDENYLGVVHRVVTPHPSDEHYVYVTSYMLGINKDNTATITIDTQKTVVDLPIVDQEFDGSSSNAQSGRAISAELDGYIPNNVAKNITKTTYFAGDVFFTSVSTKLDMNGRKILHVGNPTNIDDAAAKGYVDTIWSRSIHEDNSTGAFYNDTTGILILGGNCTLRSGKWTLRFDVGVRIYNNGIKNLGVVVDGLFVLVNGEIFPVGETGTECELTLSSVTSDHTIVSMGSTAIMNTSPDSVSRPVDAVIKEDSERKKRTTKKSNGLE